MRPDPAHRARAARRLAGVGIDATVLPTSQSARVVSDTIARDFPPSNGSNTMLPRNPNQPCRACVHTAFPALALAVVIAPAWAPARFRAY